MMPCREYKCTFRITSIQLDSLTSADLSSGPTGQALRRKAGKPEDQGIDGDGRRSVEYIAIEAALYR